jgi:class 3 adenylate cyclase/tetratricopeptide (TPR) repeat protein
VDIAAWLKSLGLEEYEHAFRENAIDADVLPKLTVEDLKDLGITAVGHRRKLLDAIAALQAPAAKNDITAPPIRRPIAAEAERRQVTVLFADLVGYTRLSQTLDAEQIHALLEHFFSCVDSIIVEYGGRVDKHIGDCVMAVFGAPVAYGNDAERAVRAALAVRQAMAAVSGEAGHELRVHIGVAGGQVMASGSGSARHHEYTVTGDSVNLAARLTDTAAPGEILVSDRVWQSLAERLDGNDAGLLDIAGFTAPVRAWRLAGLRGRPHARPLVGRHLEIEQLLAVLKVCRESARGRAVYIRGEAGIGKTRLLEEFLAIARQQGFLCHLGLVLDFGTGTGRDASRSLVRDILGLEPDSPEEAARTAADAAFATGLVASEAAVFLNDLLGLSQPLELRAVYDAMDNATRIRGKCDTILRLAERASRIQPRVLAVEDVHWADALTLANLAGLAATVAECPVILVMTSRLEQDPIDPAWRAQAGGSPLVGLDLGPLHAEEAQALAAPFFAANAAIVARCVERAAGNPLFLEQLLRYAEEDADSSVPDSVQSLVQARLDRLKTADRTALQAASVLGQRFDPQALAHLLGQPEYAPGGLTAHFMVRPQGEEFLFAHALIHDAIYTGLLKSRRRELHRRAAEWFACRDPALRAAHLDRAEDPEAARAYLVAARAQAAEYRYETAKRLVERGLELATERADRFALSCFLGHILLYLGVIADALQAFQAALETAADDAERCRAWIGCAAVKRITDDLDGAFADLERAEAAAVAHGLTVEEARLRFLRGNLYFPRGNVEGCLREHARSLELARQAHAAEEEAAALGGVGDAEYVLGRMISAYRRLSECVEVARRHGFGRIEVANSAQIAHAMMYFRPQSEVLACARAAVAAAAQVGHMRAELNARIAIYFALFALGKLTACRAEIERAHDLLRRLGAWRFEQNCLLHLGRIELAAGRRDEAIEFVRRAFEASKRTGHSFHGPNTCGGLALVLEGREERRAALAEGERLIAHGCVGHNQLRFYPDAIEVALQLADYDEAERYAALLEDFTRPEPLPWSEFFIARGRMLAAVGRGTQNSDLVDALHHLRKEGERMGYSLALPAIEMVLASTAVS